MSRYMDVEWLKQNFNTVFWSQITKTIDSAPSIDIVRCRECAKANTENCSHSYWDDDWGVWRVGYKGDDWFCADGEREGE